MSDVGPVRRSARWKRSVFLKKEVLKCRVEMEQARSEEVREQEGAWEEEAAGGEWAAIFRDRAREGTVCALNAI